ncbi:MAG: helix-turn-helix domain-containing protein [Parcubacteria group bacterium]|nr:helix-turn-helix domain-containing protein [Parcubacteria group bacterium]
MTSFVSKPIISSQTVGEQLHKAREGAGLSVDSLSRFLGIKRQYLEAIESGGYSELPGEIYGLEFIKRYASALRMDPRKAAERYRAELKTAQPSAPAWRLFTNPGVDQSGARWLSRGLVAAGFAVFAWYAVLFGKNLLGPPKLAIDAPAEYSKTQDTQVVIQGSVRGGRTVLLNGEALPVGADGSFAEVVSLPAGYHVLRITARSRTGKETSVYRAVLVQRPLPQNLVFRTGN